MTSNYYIINEKLQSDINREAAKILALSSGKIDKYESDQSVISVIFWSKKSDRKQIKAIEDCGKQLVEFNALVKKK